MTRINDRYSTNQLLRSGLAWLMGTLVAACLFLWSVTAIAQGPPHAWSYGFGSTVSDKALSVAADNLGNSLVTGHFALTADFGGGNLVSAGSNDIFLIKYDGSGAHVWSKRLGGTGTDEGYAVAVDASNNILLTGAFSDTVDFGGGPLGSAGSRDIFIAKFDANGTHVWSKSAGNLGNEWGFAIAVDASDNVLVTGLFLTEVSLGGTTIVDAGNGGAFLVKYNAGGTHQWSQSFGGSSTDIGRGVAADGSGNIFLTGTSEGTADFGGGNLAPLGGSDIILAKYDAAGVHQWSQRFGNVNNELAFDVEADGAGNVVMAGAFIGNVDFGGGIIGSGFNLDVLLAKYNSAGAHVWSQRFGALASTGGIAIPSTLALDAADSIVVTGYFTKMVDFGGGLLDAGGSNREIFLAKYAPDGAHAWSTDFGTTATDDGEGVDLDPSGQVVLAGYFSSAVDFGGGNILTEGGDDVFVAKFGANPATGVGSTPKRESFELVAYPNPFNPETTIRYTIPRSGHVTIAVHDARGARITSLVDANKPSGPSSVRWNGKDSSGNHVASGVYFARMTFGGTTQNYKIVLAK